MGHEGTDPPGIDGTLYIFESTHRAFAKIEPDFRADAVALKEPSGTPPRSKLQAARCFCCCFGVTAFCRQ